MGDRAAASISVFGVAGKEAAIAAIVDGYFGEGWGEYHGVSVEFITEGCQVCDDEASTGVFDEVCPELRKIGVSYFAEQASNYECPAEVTMFTPALGGFTSASNGEGAILVYGSEVDSICTEEELVGADITTLRKRLAVLTGRAHRVALRRAQRPSRSREEGVRNFLTSVPFHVTMDVTPTNERQKAMTNTTITVAGVLYKEPEIRYTKEGIAESRLYVDATQDLNDEPTSFIVKVLGYQGENCVLSVKKGDRVIVTGSLTGDVILATEVGASLMNTTADIQTAHNEIHHTTNPDLNE